MANGSSYMVGLVDLVHEGGGSCVPLILAELYPRPTHLAHSGGGFGVRLRRWKVPIELRNGSLRGPLPRGALS